MCKWWLLLLLSAVVWADCHDHGAWGGLPCLCHDNLHPNNVTFASNCTAENNCAYRQVNDTGIESESLLGCIILRNYGCDNYWAMSVGMYDADIDAQVIQLPMIVDGDTTDVTFCFDDKLDSTDCQECFYLSQVNVQETHLSAFLQYSFVCPQGALMNLTFGLVETDSAACGDPGYYYPSCGFDSTILASPKNAVQDDDSPIYVDKNSSSAYYGCVVSRPPVTTPDQSDYPLYCPLLLLDTCSQVARVSTYQGFEFEIQLKAESTEEVSCITDKETYEELCLRVWDVELGQQTLSLRMELNSYISGVKIVSLDLGTHQEWYPPCGGKESDCAPNYPTTPSPTPLPSSSAKQEPTTDGDDKEDEDWRPINIFLFIVLVSCISMVVIVSVAIVVLIRRRRNSFIPAPRQVELEDHME